MVRARVAIVEVQLKQYRRAFFLDLERRLRAHDVELSVVYSPPPDRDIARRDSIELDPPLGARVPATWLLDRVMFQPIWRHIRDADLVITEQGNRVLFNYILLALSRLRLKRVAYWGHGYNHQATARSWPEALKRKLLTSVDWWFSYTGEVTRYLIANGVEPGIISTVNNTVDTYELTDSIAAVGEDQLRELRRTIGIADDAVVGLYCGAVSVEKQPQFLLDTAAAVRRRVPRFELVVVGDGSERASIEKALPFVHSVGGVFGAARAPYFALASVFVMPALVGLAAVDAFSAELPLFTTALPTHGPEIEYVQHGRNGAILPHDVERFAAGIADVLMDDTRLEAMRNAARDTATRLSLDAMTSAFTDGILRCLGL